MPAMNLSRTISETIRSKGSRNGKTCQTEICGTIGSFNLHSVAFVFFLCFGPHTNSDLSLIRAMAMEESSVVEDLGIIQLHAVGRKYSYTGYSGVCLQSKIKVVT